MFTEFKNEDLSKKPKELEKLVKDLERKIEDLKKTSNKTYESFMLPYQDLNEELELFFTPLSILQYTKNSEETQKAYSECLPILTEFGTNQSQDLELFKIYKDLKSESTLNYAQKKVLEDGIKDFELDGASLEDEKKHRVKEINLRLSELSNNFSQNLLDATNDYELIIEDESKLGEMPSSDKELAKEEIDGKTVYKFTLQPHSFSAFITYSPDRDLREEIYKAYTTRAPQNEDIIDEILKLKKEKTAILGFPNYAEYSLATKMAESSDEVLGFLTKLLERTKEQGKKELAELEEFAGEKLNSYDTGYYSKKLEIKKFDLDDEKYKPFFEKSSVVEGLLLFLNKLFGIKFIKTKASVWDETVMVYDILEDEKVISRIYMDLESRPEKRGGAWMDSWQTRKKCSDGKLEKASAYISCNFPPAKGDTPSLLKHDDVVTLFHEMGHGIHHLFTKVDEGFVSGISGVEWDAVEFPSQWLENFAYESEVLKMFAKHYQTGETIPDNMIQNLIDAKNFQSALAMIRQLEFAIFDIEIHKEAKSKEEVQDILDMVREKTALIKPPSYNKFQNGFSHIFGGGYAAGYYSYKWAEVLSADGFYIFKDGGIFNQETAKRFRETVLALGGSKPAKEVFKEFANREPDVESLLRLSGIAV